MTDLSVVVPVFNEADGLAAFHSRLVQVLGQLNIEITIIYVNDGSTDSTQNVLGALTPSRFRLICIELSRNFGHQAALSAGLEQADARLTVMLDGDGQHPPELIPDMLKLQSLGYDIVQGQRIDTDGSSSVPKQITARMFYLLLKLFGEIDLPRGSADFRLITRDVLLALRSLPEYHRFVRGMVAWLGFKSILLPYHPEPRNEGQSKYTFQKMLRLANDGIFSFSLVPLKLGLVIGMAFLLLGLTEIVYVIGFWILHIQDRLVPGWSSLIIMLTLSSASTMILLGFIGIYVGMIFQEVKKRPIFVVRGVLDQQAVATESRASINANIQS
jgi:polyisoprenyl-phosphate glycosyltransferase